MHQSHEDAAPSRFTFHSTQEGVGTVEVTGICLALAESSPAVPDGHAKFPDGTNVPTVRYTIGIYRTFDDGVPGYLGVVTKQSRDAKFSPPFVLVREAWSVDDLMAWVKGINPSLGVKWRREVPSTKWGIEAVKRFKYENQRDRARDFRLWELAMASLVAQIGVKSDQTPSYTLSHATQLLLEQRAAKESASPAELVERLVATALTEEGDR